MNFFGLNSAPINGGVFAIVLGAAVIAAGSNAQAFPTNTQTADPIRVSVSAEVRAGGVRTALPSAKISGESRSSAEWVLATTASAGITVTTQARATNTDVLGRLTSTGEATGTKVHIGEVFGAAYSGGTATASRMARTPVLALVTAWAEADASVKRAGQTTTERDGYAVATVGVTTLAGGEKTTLGTAIGNAYVSAAAEGTHVHGGRATISCGVTIEATGANDTAIAVTTVTVTADPTVVVLGSANVRVVAEVEAFSSVARNSERLMTLIESTATADGRLAQRGLVRVLMGSVATVDGRLAARGEAYTGIAVDVTAYANAIRFGGAAARTESGAIATGTRVCMGESLIASTVIVTADAIANPTTPAPESRTMRVPPESRAMTVPFQNRVMRIE